MSIYKRYFGKTNCMCFMIKDKNLGKFWGKVSNIIKKKQ